MKPARVARKLCRMVSDDYNAEREDTHSRRYPCYRRGGKMGGGELKGRERRKMSRDLWHGGKGIPEKKGKGGS